MLKQIVVTQTRDTFTLELVSGNIRTVVISDKDGPPGLKWWLDRSVYNVRETLEALGCPPAQLEVILEKLASDTDVYFVVNLPPHRAAREIPTG